VSINCCGHLLTEPNPIATGGLLWVIQPRSNPDEDTVNEVGTGN
jgi:hypothetical protein